MFHLGGGERQRETERDIGRERERESVGGGGLSRGRERGRGGRGRLVNVVSGLWLHLLYVIQTGSQRRGECIADIPHGRKPLFSWISCVCF